MHWILGLVSLALVSTTPAVAAERSWQEILRPYSEGAALLDSWRIRGLRYGVEDDVIARVQREGSSDAVEVHILPRGRWQGVRESESFGIAYEIQPTSPRKEDCEAVTELLAQHLRQADHGLPWPAAIPLGASFEPGIREWWMSQEPDVRWLQAAWLLLFLVSPVVCRRAARAAGVAVNPTLLLAGTAVIASLLLTADQPDQPLHANGHAWREAREVLLPWGIRSTGASPYLHGRSGIALQWLLAGLQHSIDGSADPFVISRYATAAAAGATTLLATVAAGSLLPGAAAGLLFLLQPLTGALAPSGSPLAIASAVLPWSFALLLTAGVSGDRWLLLAAAGSAALGVMSHSALAALPPAYLVSWLLLSGRRIRLSPVTLISVALLIAALVAELAQIGPMLAARDQDSGLFLGSWMGVSGANLLLDSRWVVPLLLPAALVAPLVSIGRRRRMFALLLATVIAAVPFFAVTACSSDAVRYQAPLIPCVAALAAAGVWLALVGTFRGRSRWIPAVVYSLIVSGMLLPLRRLPVPPMDPAAIEHALVVEAGPRIAPGSLILLPPQRMDGVISDFPDFLLPRGTRVAFAGDPAVAGHTGPRLLYLGLACISGEGLGAEMRQECQALRGNAQPWLVRALRRDDLPTRADGTIWSFHPLATDVPFGFFVPAPDGSPR